MDIVSVKQNTAGMWVVTLNGAFIGDSRPQPSKEAAIEYAKKLTKDWIETEYRMH